MADFTKTVTNSINVFGSGPSTKWDLFSWGVGKWGEGSEDLIQSIGKNISVGSVTLSGAAITFSVGKLIADSISSATSLFFSVGKLVSSATTLTSNIIGFSVGKFIAVGNLPATGAVNRFDVIKVYASSITPSSALTFTVTKVISVDLPLLGDIDTLTLEEPNGWTYEFISEAADANDRDEVSWTEEGDSSATWAAESVPSTTWSQE